MTRYERLSDEVRMVVFDWDGTLLDSTDHIVSSLCAAAARLGWAEPSRAQARRVIGLGMPEVIRALFGERTKADAQRYRQVYSEIFFAYSPTRADLFPGVESVLTRLREAGYRLAIATGKSRPGLDRVLRSLELEEMFEVTRCADESQSKPHPGMLYDIQAMARLGPHQMVMVGDTTFDLEMAKRASVPGIGVAYGAHSPDKLIPYAPLAILEQINALPRLMENGTKYD